MATHQGPTPKSILVVDDEVSIRSAISEYLRDCGYEVIEAFSADEALSILQHLEIKVDVVLSDITMPGSVDGFDLRKWIRANRPEIDVILTGTAPRAAVATTELCRSGPLPKPYDPQIVIQHIMRLRQRP
jgi:CheY-like chemotaxis protein